MNKMTYENIKLKEHDRGDGVKVQSVITPFLQPLIEKLALKYPQWAFEEENTNYKWDIVNGKSVKTDISVTCFKVLDKREELGQVYIDSYSSQGMRFCIDNFRVQKMRERGSGMKTIHENKALKHVDKFFGKKNLDEKLLEAKELAQRCVQTVANNLGSKFDWEWNRLDEVAKQFIMDKHWEEFTEFVATNISKNTVDMDKMPEKFERKVASKQVKEVFAKDEHYLIYVDGQSYAIFRKNEPTQIKASEELPEFIRRSVGMLKLVEDNQIISGIGCRVNSTTYVVLPQN
jgi:hypothetical protein